MKDEKDIRWKQRFKNFERAFRLLERSLKISKPSETEIGGIIQFYEMSFELSWKMMKDYLNLQGFDVKTPREAIKQAFQIELVQNGHLWLKALGDRNLTTHTYDEKTALKVLKSIRQDYFPAISQLHKSFESKLKK